MRSRLFTASITATDKAQRLGQLKNVREVHISCDKSSPAALRLGTESGQFYEVPPGERTPPLPLPDLAELFVVSGTPNQTATGGYLAISHE